MHCTKKKKKEISIKDLSVNVNKSAVFLRIWLCLLKKSLMEKFIFCAVMMETLVKNRLKHCKVVNILGLTIEVMLDNVNLIPLMLE